jgi:hypothetical protein
MIVRFPLDFFVGITPEYRPGIRLRMSSGFSANISLHKRAASRAVSHADAGIAIYHK